MGEAAEVEIRRTCSSDALRTTVLAPSALLDLDAHAFPKGDTVLDFGGCGLWCGVRPCGIVIADAIHFDMIVLRSALPRTDRGVIAGLEKFLFDTVGREILVALHHPRSVAFRDDFSTPRCFGHFARLPAQKDCATQDIATPLNMSRR